MLCARAVSGCLRGTVGGIHPAIRRTGKNTTLKTPSAILYPTPFSTQPARHSRVEISFTTIKDLLRAEYRPNSNGSAEIVGWVRSVRKMKNVRFAVIGDGSTARTLQAVIPKEMAEGISTGASVKLTGTVVKSPGEMQEKEFHVTAVELLGESDPATYPIQKKYQTAEYLRTMPHLRLRTTKNALLLQLRSKIIAATVNFFDEKGFVQSHPPIITSSDCEGAGEVFTLAGHQTGAASQGNGGRVQHHFRDPKYLTVSSQLHLEAMVHSVSRVWTLSPTFRAERSDTNRHLSEFYMLEAETYAESLDDLLNLTETLLRGLVESVQRSSVGKELLEISTGSAEISDRWNMVLGEQPWSRMDYSEAIVHLTVAHSAGKATFSIAPNWSHGLASEHERYLADNFGVGGKPGPIFITNYPKEIKPFYMLLNETSANSEKQTVACFDLLLPTLGEVVGGSLREHRYLSLLHAMATHKLLPASSNTTSPDISTLEPTSPEFTKALKKLGDKPAGNLQWYADLRKWGSIPHGGFGVGFDRFLAWICGVENLREVVAFPRWFGRCDC